MLSSNVVVVETACLIDGELDDFLCPWGETDLTHHHGLAAANDELDSGTHLGELHAHVAEHARCHPISLANEAQEKVFGPDVVVVETLGLFLSQREHLPGALCELIELV